MQQAILFFSHLDSPWVRRQFAKLESGAAGFGDVIWLYHQPQEGPSHGDWGSRAYVVDNNVGSQLGFSASFEGLVPGQEVFPVIQFSRENPQFEFIWVVEYDVWFLNWQDFFPAFQFEYADLLAAHIYPFANCPEWYWWDKREGPAAEIPKERLLRSFNPIFRISKDGLKHLDDWYSKGAWAHYEVSMPSAINLAGLTIEDIGGYGPFVPVGRRGLYFQGAPSWNGQLMSGSHRYRPGFLPVSAFRPAGQIFHPVKPWSWWLEGGRLTEPFLPHHPFRRLLNNTPLLWRLGRRIGSRAGANNRD